MLILLGVHIISIGLFVKVFCYTENLTRDQRCIEQGVRLQVIGRRDRQSSTQRWLKRLPSFTTG